VVNEGQVEYILGTFACHLATKVPRNKNTGEKLSAATIQLYFGKVKERLKELFPEAVDWASESSWYQITSDNMKATIERNSELDGPSNPVKTVPIYHHNQPALVHDPGEGGADLDQILFNLIKTNSVDKFQRRLYSYLYLLWRCMRWRS
jgi:hypothetical protein